jgi:hypothetical protein
MRYIASFCKQRIFSLWKPRIDFPQSIRYLVVSKMRNKPRIVHQSTRSKYLINIIWREEKVYGVSKSHAFNKGQNYKDRYLIMYNAHGNIVCIL